MVNITTFCSIFDLDLDLAFDLDLDLDLDVDVDVDVEAREGKLVILYSFNQVDLDQNICDMIWIRSLSLSLLFPLSYWHT